MTRSTRLLESLRELSDNLKGYAEDLRRDGAYRCCMGTYEHVIAHIDAILRESEASVPVAATLDEAAADPALTLDVARELLRDAAAGIRRLAAKPAEGREECQWGGCGDYVGHEAAQPAGDGARELHAHLLDMLGARDHEDAARIIAEHHAREIQVGDGARVTEVRKIVELATRLRDRYVANRHDSRYTFIACITPGVHGRDACHNDGGVAADWIALDDALNALVAREGGAS